MAKKDVKEKKVNDTIIKVPISKFIDTQFRNYALYVLEARGIPSFYDGLTNIQRYILKNCPSTFVKTMTVVGKCIEDHYHHGPASLESSIARMTRPYGNATEMLQGYGFFGTEVCPTPSAARYTAVKIAPQTKDLLSKYNYLTTRVPEGPYNHFWIDLPLGLTIPIIGIAVGYKTMILPRKLEEIQKFLNGKKADLKPYMQGFNGTIKQYQSHKNWLIQGTVTVDGKKIHVTNMPPILKYSSILKKIDVLFSKYDGKLSMENNSDTTVNITFNYKGNSEDELKEITNFLVKTFSIIVTENIVLIKDAKVLEYDSIQEYLNDWKWQAKRLAYESSKYQRDFANKELKYNKDKYKFISFILAKKRDVSEIDEFFESFVSDADIKERLERLTSKKFTKDELKLTENSIKEWDNKFKESSKETDKLKIEFEMFPDPTAEKSKASKKMSMSLFDSSDISEIDGIMVWDGEDQISSQELREAEFDLEDENN